MSKLDFLEAVREGQQGLNEGLPNAFDRMNAALFNTQRRTYYAIGGLPGSGKSTLADCNFVLTPFFKMLDSQDPRLAFVEWDYYSFEIDYLSKRAKWICYRLFDKYKLLVDANYIMSRGKNRISQDVYNKVVLVNQEMDLLFDKINFVEDPTNPTGIYKEILHRISKTGTMHMEPYTYLDDKRQPQTGQRFSYYTPNDTRNHRIIIIDHMALTKEEKGMDTKKTIDKLSRYLVELRNKCGATCVAVVQFNRGLTSIERLKFKGEELLPTLEDFKDTGNVGQDCNTALGMFNPFKMDMESHLDYKIRNGFEDTFRATNIMKNRDGKEWVHMGMHFVGGANYLKELPPAETFEVGINQISTYTNLNKSSLSNYNGK